MRHGKKVSIIVPAYNASDSLHHCINSILNQTYEEIELILINDGSTDHSGMICDAYADIDDRVLAIHQKNSGPSSARNTGIKVASGDYIQFVDADDHIETNMTESLVQAMTEDVQLVICGYTSVYPRKNKTQKRSFLPQAEGTFHQNEFIQHVGRFYKNILLPSPCNKLYESQFIKENNIRFPEEVRIGEDLLFNLDYLDLCHTIHIIKEPLYNYMINNHSSLSRNFTKDLIHNQHMLYSKVKRFLIKKNSYSGENKRFLKIIYANSIVNSLNNLFHECSALTPDQRKAEINKIISDEYVQEYQPFFNDSIQSKYIGLMIKHRSTNSIYYFFKLKNKLRFKMYPVFNLLKSIHTK